MSKSFEDKLIDEFVSLHLKLNYPRTVGEGYANGREGTFERLQDEIKIEYLKKIISLNPDWNISELSNKASEKINKKRNCINFCIVNSEQGSLYKKYILL